MKEMFSKIMGFLAQYDFATVMKIVRELKMEQVLRNPVVWLVTIPIVAFCVVRRQYKILVVGVSFLLLLFLISYTVPQGDDTMSAEKLVTFVGGMIGLIGVNFYLLFVRDI